MDISIEAAKSGEYEILKNLLEKYVYELSQYFGMDVNDLGLYGCNYLDYYFSEEKRHPFFIKVDNKLAGFILVSDYPEGTKTTDYTLSEFFVMYKYRRNGVGKYSVKYILDKLKGTWQLKFHPNNDISKQFWMKTIEEYTNGKYELIKDDPHPDAVLDDEGTIGHILIFES